MNGQGEAMKRSDTILLEGIELPARLGVSEAERAMRRPVRVDLEVVRDLQAAGRSDALTDTIDYQTIYDLVAEVVAKHEFRLVEALAERVAEVLCASFLIECVTITVRKAKPVAGVLETAGVRITRFAPTQK